ncbi:MAG: hypothetical protein R3F19_34970, partial [Verrucomicrobiales bacterium]
ALNKVPPWGAPWDQAFGRLFEEDPSKAIEAFQQLSETNQAACTRNFARQWAEVDPKAALKWAEENGNREVVHSVIETTARKDPLAALRSVKSWNSDELRDAVSAGFSDWSSSQLIEAMQQLKSEGNDDWHVWKSAQERLLQEHRGRPDAACAQIGSIQDDELRERMSLEYAKNCPLTDIAAVLPWLEQQFLSERELKEIGSNLGAKLFDPILKDHPDPRELVSLLSSGPLRDSLQRAIDAEQAVRSGDYATFAAWYETISGLLELSGQVRDIVQSHIDRLREQSPSEAAKFAASLGGDTSTSRLGATLFDWFQRDPETASNWVANSSKDVSVQAVRQSAAAVADFWTRADPVAAAAWATSLNGEAHEVAIDRVASIWTWQNPSEAVAWASAFEDVDLRARASGIVARNWLEADPYGATEWLATLEHGEVRDQTIAGMMPEAGRYFDDTLNLAERTAIQWLADVDDRTLRRDTLSRLFRWEAWVDEGGGPKKLAAILTSAGILEDDVRAIRAAAEQRQAEPNPESDSDDDDPFSSQ